MARFGEIATREILPVTKPKRTGPSSRSVMQEQYRNQLTMLVDSPDGVLPIELDPEDKPLTIRNRINAAAKHLGLNVKVQRRANLMLVSHAVGDVPAKKNGNRKAS